MLPPTVDDPDAAPLEAEVAQRHSDVVRIFRQSRDEAIALLASPSLKRTSYGPISVAVMARRMEAFLAAPLIERDGMEDLRRWTSSALRAATRKNETTPAHPLFDACDALFGCLTRLHALYERKLLALKIGFLSGAQRLLDPGETDKEPGRVRRSAAARQDGP